MQMSGIPDLNDILYKLEIVFGVIIVIYGLLWLFVNLGFIPPIIAAVFPQIVLIIIGLFIIYTAVDHRNKYY